MKVHQKHYLHCPNCDKQSPNVSMLLYILLATTQRQQHYAAYWYLVKKVLFFKYTVLITKLEFNLFVHVYIYCLSNLWLSTIYLRGTSSGILHINHHPSLSHSSTNLLKVFFSITKTHDYYSNVIKGQSFSPNKIV